MANLLKIANELNDSDWNVLGKQSKYQVKTKPRRRPKNVKQQVVKRRKFKKIRTEAEHVAEFSYRPGKCNSPYRMIVVRKTLKVIKGDMNLFDDVRYFFYITNESKRSAAEMVEFIGTAATMKMISSS